MFRSRRRSAWRQAAIGLLLCATTATAGSSTYPLLRRRHSSRRTQSNNNSTTPSKRITNNSQDRPSIERVVFSNFELILAHTEEALSPDELDTIHGRIESVLEEQLTPAVSHVFLGDMSARHLNDQTTLSFPVGGVADFFVASNSSASPIAQVEDQVEGEIKQACETKLAADLQQYGFPSIDRVVYLSDRVRDSRVAAGGIVTDDDDTSVGAPIVLIASTVLVGAAAVLLAALLVFRRRKGAHDDHNVDHNNTNSNLPAERQVVTPITAPHRPKRLSTLAPVEEAADQQSESSSVQESESSFTVHTEEGDTTAVKSVSRAAVPMVQKTESFEKDIRVNLRKDMLTSAWIINQPPSANRGAQQLESVLQPSHFTASQERRERQDIPQQQLQFRSAQGEDAFWSNKKSPNQRVDNDRV